MTACCLSAGSLERHRLQGTPACLKLTMNSSSSHAQCRKVTQAAATGRNRLWACWIRSCWSCIRTVGNDLMNCQVDWAVHTTPTKGELAAHPVWNREAEVVHTEKRSHWRSKSDPCVLRLAKICSCFSRWIPQAYFSCCICTKYRCVTRRCRTRSVALGRACSVEIGTALNSSPAPRRCIILARPLLSACKAFDRSIQHSLLVAQRRPSSRAPW